MTKTKHIMTKIQTPDEYQNLLYLISETYADGQARTVQAVGLLYCGRNMLLTVEQSKAWPRNTGKAQAGFVTSYVSTNHHGSSKSLVQ